MSMTRAVKTLNSVVYDIKTDAWREDKLSFTDKLIEAYSAILEDEAVSIQTVIKNIASNIKVTYTQSLALQDIANIVFNMSYDMPNDEPSMYDFLFTKYLYIDDTEDDSDMITGEKQLAKITVNGESRALDNASAFTYIVRKIGLLQTAYMLILLMEIRTGTRII